MGRVGKSRRRRKARQSGMEPLLDNLSNGPLFCTKENALDGCATCIGAGSADASEDPRGTSTFSRACNLDVVPGTSQEGIALRVEHEENNADITSSLHSGAGFPSEHQLVRFEEYVRPVLELFKLPQLPASVLSSVWTEVAPYQVTNYTCVSVNSICEFLFDLRISM